MNKCPKCRKPHGGPHKTCQKCLDYKRQYFKSNYSKWVTLGLCPWCHTNPPRKEGGVYCEECIKKMKTLTPYNKPKRTPSSNGSSKTSLEGSSLQKLQKKENQEEFLAYCSQWR